MGALRTLKESDYSSCVTMCIEAAAQGLSPRRRISIPAHRHNSGQPRRKQQFQILMGRNCLADCVKTYLRSDCVSFLRALPSHLSRLTWNLASMYSMYCGWWTWGRDPDMKCDGFSF